MVLGSSPVAVTIIILLVQTETRDFSRNSPTTRDVYILWESVERGKTRNVLNLIIRKTTRVLHRKPFIIQLAKEWQKDITIILKACICYFLLFQLKSSFNSADIQIFVFLSSPLFIPVSHCSRGWLKISLCQR